MGRKHALSRRFYTTDVDASLAGYEAYAAWIAPAGIMPPQTLPGISRLAIPELLVEIGVVAGM